MAVPKTSKPVPIQRVPPTYPPMAEYEAIQGKVLVCFTVEADGTLANLHVEKAEFRPRNHPVIHGDGNANREALKRAAKQTLKAESVYTVAQWRFKPGLKDGKPVKTPDTCQMIRYKISG